MTILLLAMCASLVGGEEPRDEIAALLQPSSRYQAQRMLARPPIYLANSTDVSGDVFIAEVLEALAKRDLGGNKKACLDKFIADIAPSLDNDSLWMEFGVYSGRTLNKLGQASGELQRSRKVFGFDSFGGLPEHWRDSELGDDFEASWTHKGSFDLGGKPPVDVVDANYAAFVVGWFNETLKPFLTKETGEISFVHVDSDLYSSASLVLQELSPRLQSGATIVFDELINYPEFRDGEMKALYEWSQAAAFKIEVVGYPGGPLLATKDDLDAAALRDGAELPNQCAIFRIWKQ